MSNCEMMQISMPRNLTMVTRLQLACAEMGSWLLCLSLSVEESN